MKTAIILGLILLTLGWFANDVYSLSYDKPTIFAVRNVISPADRIKDSQIVVYEDKIVINIDNANWANYTATYSMDPFLDIGATGIEVVPKDEFDVQIGDVITYGADWTEGLVAHRVIDVGYDADGWYAVAKGDNVSCSDPGKIRFDKVKFILVGVLY
ncbi:hypothetical protein K8R33_00800 [archaeon]|nr:hypothetical protein [archaeon]